MKKRNAIIASMMVLSLGAGLCIPGAAVQAGEDEYDIDAMEVSDVTVKLYHRMNADGGDPESEYFIKKVDEWNQQKNGITIETVFISTENDYLDRLATDIASGDAPDIFMQVLKASCQEI